MIISSKKYACETCIKGHRSSACKHTDRPLFEIKKKGRPVTQCEHCRELRKTKQVHVKCKCVDYSASQEGPKPGFESAAFPNGLPEALEATVAFQNPAEGSDSDHGGVVNGHHCKSGDPCKCVSPRARTRPRGPSQTQLNPALPSGSSSSFRDFSSHPSQLSSSSSQIISRTAVLRPVLPRPTQQDMGFPFLGPVHDPSTGIPHGHASNRHYDNYAPYTRHGMAPQNIAHPQSYVASLASSNPTFSFTDQPYQNDPVQVMGIPPHASWPPQSQQGNALVNRSPTMCACGDECACPGCVHHNCSTLLSSSAYASCRNPDRCGTCLHCTIMSLPSSAIPPPDTALSIYNDSQNDVIDDWLRQISASNLNSQQGFNGGGGGGPLDGWNTNPNPNPNRAFPPFADNNSMARDSRGIPNFNFASNSMIHSQPQQPSSNSMSGSRSQPSVFDPCLLSPNPTMMGGGGNNPAFFNVPRSRSPSTSSQSSHHGSDSHNNSIAGGRPSGRLQGMFTDARGVRSPPQLNTRPNMPPGPNSSSSMSPSSSSGSGSGSTSARPLYASCDSGDPSLTGLRIY